VPIETGTCEQCHRPNQRLKRLTVPTFHAGVGFITDICIDYESCIQVAYATCPHLAEAKDFGEKARRIQQERVAKEKVRLDPKTGEPRMPKEEKKCGCGCKVMTKSEFAPGHDARLKSALYAKIRGESPKASTIADDMTVAQAKKFLDTKGWPHPAERKPRAPKATKATKSSKKTTKKAAKAGKA
jgi:hypothetical protein